MTLAAWSTRSRSVSYTHLIDQSFVSRLEAQDDSTIVSTVLTIAAGMGAETVAEGIEVPDQHKRLLALGCRLGQGDVYKRQASNESVEVSEPTPAQRARLSVVPTWVWSWVSVTLSASAPSYDS